MRSQYLQQAMYTAFKCI